METIYETSTTHEWSNLTFVQETIINNGHILEPHNGKKNWPYGHDQTVLYKAITLVALKAFELVMASNALAVLDHERKGWVRVMVKLWNIKKRYSFQQWIGRQLFIENYHLSISIEVWLFYRLVKLSPVDIDFNRFEQLPSIIFCPSPKWIGGQLFVR